MELTVREVATLLGRSPRTIRARVASGELPGVKRGGTWRIPRRALPLTETQRRALQARADDVRRTVDAALPSRAASTHGDRRRSIVDLDAFRLGFALLRDLRGADGPLAEQAAPRLREALLDLADGVHTFERHRKLDALHAARSRLGRVAGLLAMEADDPLSEPVFGWLRRLETEVLPALAGFVRWAERLPGRRRS